MRCLGAIAANTMLPSYVTLVRCSIIDSSSLNGILSSSSNRNICSIRLRWLMGNRRNLRAVCAGGRLVTIFSGSTGSLARSFSMLCR